MAVKKKPILTKYIDHIYYMQEEKAIEFDRLFDALLIILKMNQNLDYDIVTHDFYNVTLYARNPQGFSDFSFRLDATMLKQVNGKCFAEEVKVTIATEIDLSLVEKLSVDGYLDTLYVFQSKYNEDDLLEIMRELIKCI